MVIDFTLLGNLLFIDQPQELIGWLGWLLLLIILCLLLYQWRRLNKQWTALQGGIFVGLVVLLVLTNLFFSFQIPALEALIIPGQASSMAETNIPLLAALPWLLAAGLLGVFSAAGLGLLSGAILALTGTHNLYTVLEYSLLATLLGAAFHQRYRTLPFRLLRHPLFATSMLAVLYPLLFILDMTLASSGSLAARLDIALSQAQVASVVMAIQLVAAGLIGEVIALVFPRLWGFTTPLEPSPVESRLQSRFLFSLALLAVLVAIGLMAADWIIASRSATNMLNDRLANTAEISTVNMSAFLETGRTLIAGYADDPTWTQGTMTEKTILLGTILDLDYFSEIYLVDDKKQLIAGYPQGGFDSTNRSISEITDIEEALNGIDIHINSIPPSQEGGKSRVSFMAPIRNPAKEVVGVLVGRAFTGYTNLGTMNPFFQSISSSLNSLDDVEGDGILMDATGSILYSSNVDWVGKKYDTGSSLNSLSYEGVTPDNTRSLMFYRPMVVEVTSDDISTYDKSELWGIVTSVPMQEAQQLALQTAAPMMVIIIILFLIAALVLRISMRTVTDSLHNLALETKRISSGQLDSPLDPGGNDEIGQLRLAFENMRSSLKARLDELNRLLMVSRGVASNLEFPEAIKPVMEAALSTGASAVRVVLTSDALPEMKGGSPPQSAFGLGKDNEKYSYLDNQIMPMVRQKEVVALNNLSRVRLLTFPPDAPRPEALLALPLHHENMFYGAIWLAYDAPHQFSEDEIRFLTTIAGQAALAAANSQLFANAEIGRQRLAATLDSTPDPVLVTDYQGHLLLANPAAWQVLSLPGESVNGKSIDSIIQQPSLLALLRVVSDEKQSAEVELPDGKIYLATASSVVVEGQPVGRVCILRDVTRFKELDTLKSEFVATVSHDLRYPLTTMRGYATMLEMVGELNEQQTGYVKKILTSVDGMNHLVTSLLDLGRIDAGVDLQLEMVPVQEVVDRVVGALQLQASQKQVVISSDISQHAIPLIEADYALLQQALHNLVENAVIYTEPRGKISVRVEPDKDQMVFTVVDTGIGIAPVDLPRIFEKFYRGGQKEAKKRQGTGLGLAIVKSIADRHKGRVWVESQLGKGSAFHLAIPFRQRKGGNRNDGENPNLPLN